MRCQCLELLTAQCTKTRVLSAGMLGRGMARDSASEQLALEQGTVGSGDGKGLGTREPGEGSRWDPRK